ncbi:hypothetical protein, partial [Rhizobium johnstonii]|uniref:hypothetical protein n=1 Tax=Rhizobium johnstonii TaxID=3019933 RepID=UPI003F9AFB29
EQINAGKVHPIIETLLSNGEAKLPPLGIPFNIADGTLRVQNVTVANDLARITADAQIALPEKFSRRAGSAPESASVPGLN